MNVHGSWGQSLTAVAGAIRPSLMTHAISHAIFPFALELLESLTSFLCSSCTNTKLTHHVTSFRIIVYTLLVIQFTYPYMHYYTLMIRTLLHKIPWTNTASWTRREFCHEFWTADLNGHGRPRYSPAVPQLYWVPGLCRRLRFGTWKKHRNLVPWYHSTKRMKNEHVSIILASYNHVHFHVTTKKQRLFHDMRFFSNHGNHTNPTNPFPLAAGRKGFVFPGTLSRGLGSNVFQSSDFETQISNIFPLVKIWRLHEGLK